MPMPLSQWLHLGLLALLWGSAHILVVFALRELPPVPPELCRMSLAALLMTIDGRLPRALMLRVHGA